MGNFNIYMPSEAQAAAGAKLIGEIRNRWNIPITRIEPHRWDDVTDCPGNRLADNWLTCEYLNRDANILIRSFSWIGDKFKLL